jgi:hypothetical protein
MAEEVHVVEPTLRQERARTCRHLIGEGFYDSDTIDLGALIDLITLDFFYSFKMKVPAVTGGDCDK